MNQPEQYPNQNAGRDLINIHEVGGDVNVINHPPQNRSQNESWLLRRVEEEVDSRLQHSLHQAVLIALGMESQPEQVKRPWDTEIKIGVRQAQPLPSHVSILDVFEQGDIKGKLLILGDPGAGKTTTLLDLAKALIQRAKQDLTQPVPVLFNLSSWTNPNQTIQDWLVAELRSKYGVRKDIGNEWLTEQRLLVLLDGLDEVKLEQQAACVQAINHWLQSDMRPMSLVVCSRLEEYRVICSPPETDADDTSTRLQLNGAIVLKKLTDEQIQDYLTQINQPTLWYSIQHDTALIALVRTPLLLSITVLSAQELSLSQWQQLTSTEQRLETLLDAYVQQMLHRSSARKASRKNKRTDTHQTQRWLTYLAQQLQRDAQTEFLIENIHPNWLTNSRLAKVRFTVATWFIVIVLFSVLCGLSVALYAALTDGLIHLFPILGGDPHFETMFPTDRTTIDFPDPPAFPGIEQFKKFSGSSRYFIIGLLSFSVVISVLVGASKLLCI